ncbi:hypothetical protein DCS_04804 [Drechmeria coniospora]|uniref:LPXTG-motif cell wall anchor domain protein n=1 Tax=Drechmeria coniospora TaxID=98403 RepID=A0A151GL85_DRECN|nr:hypothetical protein DCS_04804 [Drechmeria coniospora]KYK57791.1 hypothetical protein DCS_04804 [Drechmeria coniospora]
MDASGATTMANSTCKSPIAAAATDATDSSPRSRPRLLSLRLPHPHPRITEPLDASDADDGDEFFHHAPVLSSTTPSLKHSPLEGPPARPDQCRSPSATSSSPPHLPPNHPSLTPQPSSRAPSSAALPNPVSRYAPSAPASPLAADGEQNQPTGEDENYHQHRISAGTRKLVRERQHPPSSPAARPSPPRSSPSHEEKASTVRVPPAAAETVTAASATSLTSVHPRPCHPKRPSSCPEAHRSRHDAATAQSPSKARTDASTTCPVARRAPASRSANGISTVGGPPSSLSTQRRRSGERILAGTAQAPRPTPTADGVDLHGRRELLLPQRLSHQSSSSDDNSPQLGASTPVRVPPIRTFRASSSRKSLVLDANLKSPPPYDPAECPVGMAHESTLRALEGRMDDTLRNGAIGGAEDSGDLFLRIAKEQSNRRGADDGARADVPRPVSRASRFTHRRPLSTVVASYHTTSPPRVARRLSDHHERPRLQDLHDERLSGTVRTTPFRSHLTDDGARARAPGSALRPSPLAPRPLVSSQETSPEGSTYARRRASITENNSGAAGRSSTFHRASTLGPTQRGAYGSPLVRSIDFKNQPISELARGGIAGTESTESTTAPSTVWDELDDIKSRIHRLELTGKLPSTSGAAIASHSDERPPTATTTVTTMSLSPKRPGARQAPETVSTTSPQKEAHPLLVAALVRSRHFMSPEAYEALESAANDAIGLSAMLGTPAQSGLISSGASTVAAGNVTDRQLRRKADSVCRSLTELCIALGDGAVAAPLSQADGPATPAAPKSYSGLPATLRADQGLPRTNGSPRTLSRFEERRSHLLNGTATATPRTGGSNVSTPTSSNIGRRPSLLVARTRRAGTEDPDEDRSSSLLRSRRAGTDEVEDGRKTSLLVRNRRGTVGGEMEELQFRSPSRATTEVNAQRGQVRDGSQETQALNSGARPRLATTSPRASRLAIPSGSSPAPPRRYLDRVVPDHLATTSRQAGDYSSRPPPTSQGMSHARASSLSTRRKRESMIPAIPASVSSGVYRCRIDQ